MLEGGFKALKLSTERGPVQGCHTELLVGGDAHTL
jgi:hypothetical protein